MNIKNKNLLINKCYVNGTWVSSDKKIKVINPATGELIAEVPNFGKPGTKIFRKPFALTKRTTVIGNMEPTFMEILRFTVQPWQS